MDYGYAAQREPAPVHTLGLCIIFAIASAPRRPSFALSVPPSQALLPRYFLTSAFAGFQLVRLNGRGAPWTTQKVLHVLVVLATFVRGTFFILAMRTWG